MKERARFTFARGPAQQSARGRLRQRNLEDAEEIKCKDEDDDAQQKNEIRICELKSAPGDFAAGSFENNQEQPQADKPGEDPRREGQTAAQNFLAALPGLLNESEDLERDHGQDARHQIQNQAAKKTKEEKGKNATCGNGIGR